MEDAVPGKVMEVLGRSGVKGVVSVRCKITEGRDAGKVIQRNVIGPIRVGDVIMLRETEMESSGSFR